MSWSTDALITVSFNRATFNTKYDVEAYIKEKQSEVDQAKKTIRYLSMMTEPNKFCPQDEDPMYWVESQIHDCLETIECNSYYIGIASDVLESWDKMHDKETGLALNCEYEDLENNQRITGDFVEHVK